MIVIVGLAVFGVLIGCGIALVAGWQDNQRVTDAVLTTAEEQALAQAYADGPARRRTAAEVARGRARNHPPTTDKDT